MTYQTIFNFCKFQANAPGQGTWTVSGPAPADGAGNHDVPANCRVVNGGVYRYYAQSPDGTETELGEGVYLNGTFSRSIIFGNSDGTTTAHNFSVAPLVDVYPSPTQSLTALPTDQIPVGTTMVFQQSSAPLGWTKVTQFNDMALRVVNGGVSFGGVLPFSACMQYRTVDGHSLSIAEEAVHSHPMGGNTNQGGSALPQTVPLAVPADGTPIGLNTGNTGGGQPHYHTYDIRLQYVDVILAQRTS